MLLYDPLLRFGKAGSSPLFTTSDMRDVEDLAHFVRHI